MWDVATGVTTRRLSGHMGKIHVVEFNEDASVVASGKSLLDISMYMLPTLVFRLVRFDRTALGPPVSTFCPT